MLAYFCFVSWFLLVTCFCARKIFSSKKKKKNKLEIILIVLIYNITDSLKSWDLGVWIHTFYAYAMNICPWIQSNLSTAQKMKISIKDFFSKCDQIRSFHADLVTFTEEILNGKFHCLCSDLTMPSICLILELLPQFTTPWILIKTIPRWIYKEETTKDHSLNQVQQVKLQFTSKFKVCP